MIYLDRFRLPIDDEESFLDKIAVYNGGAYGYIDNPYPCRIFSENQLDEINFDSITIFYGSNGSGKSTLLNLIAEKLQLGRIAPRNSGEVFDLYTANCEFKLGVDDFGDECIIPDNSKIITSDDIFDYMLAVRSNNDAITEKKKQLREDYAELKYGKNIKLNSMDDFEEFRTQVEARSKSRRQFIRKNAGAEAVLISNGETAMQYFERNLMDDTFYCLDEPENSLSPKLQQELVKLIEQMAKYCGCQFIIATHSPFILATDRARIYDLDDEPVSIKKWWELDNARTYFEFFYEHRQLFGEWKG